MQPNIVTNDQPALFSGAYEEVFAAMPSEIHGTNGIERLIQKFKQEFRIQENLEHYSGEDYARAERGFVQFCLKQGGPGASHYQNSA